MKVVIKRQRPMLRALLVILVVVAMGATGWTLLQRERERQYEQQRDVSARYKLVAAENRRLVAENEKLTRRLARVERTSQIEARAYTEVDAHLKALQEELQAAREEVSFYQGITAESGGRGVRIQRFTIVPMENLGHFQFRLVLTRGLKDDTVFEGSVVLAVDGEMDSRAKRLAHQQTVVAHGAEIAFKFRYFQRIESELVLPERFIPKSVTVQVRSNGKPSSNLEESFAWPS